MIPVIGSDGWFFMPLRGTRYAPPKIAKLKVVDGLIVQGFAREGYPRTPELPPRRLHWAAGLGSWTES